MNLASPSPELLQKWIAFTSVGPSTVRKYPPDTGPTLKELLRQVDLDALAAGPTKGFQTRLDAETDRIVCAMPTEFRPWGVARKVLNVFLRGSAYNWLLRDRFRLDRIEAELEVPLDSISAKAIIALSKGEPVPRWRGVKHLTPAQSEQFQRRARVIAESWPAQPTFRVHLDIVFWMNRDSWDTGC